LGLKKVKGYEIHMGTSKGINKPLNRISKKLGEEVSYSEGCVNEEGNVIGTYLHGIFDDIEFTRTLLNNIRFKKGLESIESIVESFEEFKNKEYDKLADILRDSLDIDKIYEIING
ncbi:MAG: cobyric acid synthase, partial [Paraclostridium sp.]